MPTLETLIAFFGVAVILALTPGPDNIFVLLQSAQRGWRAGLAVVVGLCAGILVHTAAVALGLAALFAASAVAFTVLKFCGAAYLAYLAWGALRAPAAVASQDNGPTPAASPVSLWRMAGRGVVMNLTNPKVLVFFLAFLPQFADPALGGVAPQLMVLGMVLGFMVESNYRRSLLISGGEHSIFVTDTASAILLGLSALLSAYSLWKEISERRKSAK